MHHDPMLVTSTLGNRVANKVRGAWGPGEPADYQGEKDRKPQKFQATFHTISYLGVFWVPLFVKATAGTVFCGVPVLPVLMTPHVSGLPPRTLRVCRVGSLALYSGPRNFFLAKYR